jgi:hypothetical protein
MTTQIKTCQCCGFTTAWLRKRVCPTCGVPAIWVKRWETEQEASDRLAKLDRLNDIAARLLSDGPRVEISRGQAWAGR